METLLKEKIKAILEICTNEKKVRMKNMKDKEIDYDRFFSNFKCKAICFR